MRRARAVALASAVLGFGRHLSRGDTCRLGTVRDDAGVSSRPPLDPCPCALPTSIDACPRAALSVPFHMGCRPFAALAAAINPTLILLPHPSNTIQVFFWREALRVVCEGMLACGLVKEKPILLLMERLQRPASKRRDGWLALKRENKVSRAPSTCPMQLERATALTYPSLTSHRSSPTLALTSPLASPLGAAKRHHARRLCDTSLPRRARRVTRVGAAPPRARGNGTRRPGAGGGGAY